MDSIFSSIESTQQRGNLLLNMRTSISFYLVPSITLAIIFVHVCFGRNLDYTADELYFVECSRHLDLGFVDVMPLVPLLYYLSQKFFGESLIALRMLPALAHAGTALLTSRISQNFGGARFAQVLACFSVAICPAFLRLGNIFTVVSLEPVLWTLLSYILIKIVKDNRDNLWLLFGLLAGLSVLTKPTIVLYGVGLALALYLTSLRHFRLRRWLWLGFLIFNLVISPNIVWQVQNHWPTLRFIASLPNSVNVSQQGAGEFLLGQILYLSPFCSLLVLLGAYYLLFAKQTQTFRFFGLIYAVLILLFVFSVNKIYYTLAAYPLLIAAGSTCLGNRLSNYRVLGERVVVACLVLISCLVWVPLAIPLLSAEKTESLLKGISSQWLNAQQAPELVEILSVPKTEERTRLLRDLAEAYQQLSSEGEAWAILASDYEDASAINVLGAKFGLPKAISGEVGFFMWGSGTNTLQRVITIGFNERFLRSLFREVHSHSQNTRLRFCRKPLIDLKAEWYRLQTFGDNAAY